MREMESLLRALADRTRLRLVNLMAGHEVCVCFLEEILDLSQPKVSRHLAYLRKAGLVEARRDGKWMHYRLNPPNDVQLAQLWHSVMRSLADDDTMKRERSKLLDLSCRPPAKITPRLRIAPRPAMLAAGRRSSRRID